MTSNKPMPIAEAKNLLLQDGYLVKGKVWGRYSVHYPDGTHNFWTTKMVRATANTIKNRCQVQGGNK